MIQRNIRPQFTIEQKRSSQASVCDLLTIYTGFIRPLVEYATPVWHPDLTFFQTSQIEMVQKRAIRLIMGLGR